MKQETISTIQKILKQFEKKQYQSVCITYESTPNQQLNPTILYIVAISYAFIQSYKTALNIMLQIKKHHHQCPDYYLYLAYIMLRNANFKQCDYYLKKTSINKNNCLYYETKVELYLYLFKLKGAQYYINQAVKKNLISVDLLINQAVILSCKNKNKMAETLLLQCLKHQPTNIIIYNNLIGVYQNVNKKRAEKTLLTYLKIKPNYVPYLWKLLWIYLDQSNNNGIKSTLKQIQTHDKNHTFINELFLIPSNYLSVSDIENHRKKNGYIIG